jgi:glycine cleavage system H lipoate-binding protein
MVVFLVAAVFLVFVTIDLMMERRRRAELVREGQNLHDRVRETEPNFVAGYEMPAQMVYHKGHTWVHWVSPDQAYIGVDDFARRLLGHPDKVELPSVGAWLDQGKRAIGFKRSDDVANLASPVSGEIIAVNPRVKSDPDVVHRDNYGHGWLYKVRSPRLAEQLQNLLDGSLAARWIEDTRDRFQHQLTLATGTVIQDGGTTVDDLASHLDHDVWRGLVDEFLETRRSRS